MNIEVMQSISGGKETKKGKRMELTSSKNFIICLKTKERKDETNIDTYLLLHFCASLTEASPFAEEARLLSVTVMDLVGPLHVSKQGSTYVLTITCLFTSFIEAIPL